MDGMGWRIRRRWWRWTRCVGMLGYEGQWRSCAEGDLLEFKPFGDLLIGLLLVDSALWGKHPSVCIVCYRNTMCTEMN